MSTIYFSFRTNLSYKSTLYLSNRSYTPSFHITCRLNFLDELNAMLAPELAGLCQIGPWTWKPVIWPLNLQTHSLRVQGGFLGYVAASGRPCVTLFVVLTSAMMSALLFNLRNWYFLFRSPNIANKISILIVSTTSLQWCTLFYYLR
jgi:hypothetical protein